MSAVLPKNVAESSLSEFLIRAGLKRVFQGKVRDTYGLANHSDLLLVVATDRVSIFDFVLPALVKDKGKVLTAMTIFWLRRVLKGYNHHLVAFGQGIGEYLPAILQNNPELQSRALVVKKLSIVPVEAIVRGYLTGSGWTAYQESKRVCGIQLPPDLHDGSKLPVPIFTPSTKAETGHDEHLDAQEVLARYGRGIMTLAQSIFSEISTYAEARGIILADTKLEFGQAGTLGDELATPDSSRYWLRSEWEEAVKQRKSPPSHDKEVVRAWGKTVETPFLDGDGEKIVGIGSLDPEDPEHIAFVHSLEVPEVLLETTTDRYREIFRLLTGSNLEEFHQSKMGV